MIEMKLIDKGEQSRTYHFGDGKTLTIKEVVALAVRPSGSHRLKDKSGKLWYVPASFIGIEIEAPDWSF